MFRVLGSAGVRAFPAIAGRPSKSGQSFVPSFTNFQPVGLVESTTGLYDRNARRTPSKPGSVNPAVNRKLLRCCRFCPPGLAVMSVFGSELPLAARAFLRLTVPTIGLTGLNSLTVLVSKSVERENPCCTARSTAAVTSNAVVTLKYWPPLLVAIACSDATSAAAGFTATTTMGMRFVTPLALTDANDDAVVAALCAAEYAASPLSFPPVIRTTTVLRHVRLAAESLVIAETAAARASVRAKSSGRSA